MLLHIAQEKDGRSDYRAFRNTQAIYITTRSVLSATLKKPGIADLPLLKRQKDPMAWLRDHLQADFPRDGEVLRVTLKGADSDDAARLLNAVAESYLDEFVSKDENSLSTRIEQLKKKAAEYNDQLANKRKMVQALAAEIGSLDSRVQAVELNVLSKELDALESERMAVQSQLRKARLELNSLEERGKKPGDAAPPNDLDEQIERDAVIRELRAEAVRLESTLAQVRAKVASPEKSAVFVDTEQQLQSVKKSLSKRQAELRPMLDKQMRDKQAAKNKADADALREQIKKLEQLEQRLSSEIKDRREKVRDFTEMVAQENRKRAKMALDADANREDMALMETLLKKTAVEIEELNAKRLASFSRITLLEKAEANRSK